MSTGATDDEIKRDQNSPSGRSGSETGGSSDPSGQRTECGPGELPSDHPNDDMLRPRRMPHIWCPGCGLGTILNSFIRAVKKAGIPQDRLAVVSGIGCTGRVAGYMNVDSYHTTHGRAIPFATGLKLANPEMTVVVFSGDGDLFAIGGNHIIHAARRNVDINVICVNNFNYGMTGGQSGPTTPISAKTTTTPYGNVEHPFNLPWVAAASGAVYVARWTALHTRQLERSIVESLEVEGFGFIEVISPCPTAYGRRNRMGTGLDMMIDYDNRSVVNHGADPDEVDIDLASKIVVGKFVDIKKPTFTECLEDGYAKLFGWRIQEEHHCHKPAEPMEFHRRFLEPRYRKEKEGEAKGKTNASENNKEEH